MFLKSILFGLPLFLSLLAMIGFLVWYYDELSITDPSVWFMVFMCAIFSILLGNSWADPGDCAGY